MASRLAWRAPKEYSSSAFDTLILAINQRLDELSTRASASDPTASAPLPVITDTTNNLVIGRGHYFELTINGANGGLTGIAGGEPGRIIILKKRLRVTQFLAPYPQLLRQHPRQSIHQSRRYQCHRAYWWRKGFAL